MSLMQTQLHATSSCSAEHSRQSSTRRAWRRSLTCVLALALGACVHQRNAGDIASVPKVDSEDAFVAACRPQQPIVVAGLWRGTFESGDFVFVDTLGFAGDSGPFAFNPASKVISLDGVNDTYNRRRIESGPRNGVGGWSYVWRVELLVDSGDCAEHLRLHRILDLRTLTSTAYDEMFRRSQDLGDQ